MSSLNEIVSKLSRKTSEGKVEWREVSGGSFLVSFESSSISISIFTPGKYKLTVYNENGVAVEQMISAELGGLHTLAMRRARKIDTLLQSLSDKLDNL